MLKNITIGIVYEAVSTTLAQLALLLSATTTLNLCYLYMGTQAHITNSGNAEFWCRLQRVDRLHQRTRLFWPLMLIKDATDKKDKKKTFAVPSLHCVQCARRTSGASCIHMCLLHTYIAMAEADRALSQPDTSHVPWTSCDVYIYRPIVVFFVAKLISWCCRRHTFHWVHAWNARCPYS